jgi:hypothetical protein
MSKLKRLYIIISILLISSITCKVPGGLTPEAPATPLPETGQAIEITKEEIITEGVDAYAADLITHPETGELMDIIQADGFTTLVEGGEFEFSNGIKLHAVSLTDGDSAVILAQVENETSSKNAIVFEFIDETTFQLWDQNGGIELTFSEDGELDYLLKDAGGNPLSSSIQPTSGHKISSIVPHIHNRPRCTFMEDFDQCVKKKRGAIPMTAVCASGLTNGIVICLTAPFAGCVIYLSALGVYCGSYFGDCILEIGDSPPTYEYSEAKETEIYNYCQNDNLVTEKLYQVQVECKDDRPPAPENLTVFLTSGEAKDFTCTDCAGQTSTGTIPPPGELVITECDYGCQIVGEGNDRCLKEGETPSEKEGETPPEAGSGSIVVARGTFVEECEAPFVCTENTVELSFYPEGGSVTGTGVIEYYDADEESRRTSKITFEFEGKSFMGEEGSPGQAKGQVTVADAEGVIETCLWQAEYADGKFEGSMCPGDEIHFSLTY